MLPATGPSTPRARLRLLLNIDTHLLHPYPH